MAARLAANPPRNLRAISATVTAAWATVTAARGPQVIALSRQGCANLETSTVEAVRKGAYALSGPPAGETADLVLVASGSEVQLVVDVAAKSLSHLKVSRACSKRPATARQPPCYRPTAAVQPPCGRPATALQPPCSRQASVPPPPISPPPPPPPPRR